MTFRLEGTDELSNLCRTFEKEQFNAHSQPKDEGELDDWKGDCDYNHWSDPQEEAKGTEDLSVFFFTVLRPNISHPAKPLGLLRMTNLPDTSESAIENDYPTTSTGIDFHRATTKPSQNVVAIRHRDEEYGITSTLSISLEAVAALVKKKIGRSIPDSRSVWVFRLPIVVPFEVTDTYANQAVLWRSAYLRGAMEGKEH